MTGSVEIVMMHRVMPEPLGADDPYHKITATTAQLERYLKTRKDWQPLRLESLAGGNIPSGKNYVVTFDDGYLDNKTHALPILEKYDVPASIFCGTQFIDGTLEPFEILLDKVLKQTDMKSVQRHSEYARLFRRFKRGSLSKRMKRLEGLARRLNVSPVSVSPDDFMRWDDVRALDKHPLITIGSHAVSHSVLWKTSPALVWRELSQSRDILRAQLGHEIDLISYPYGRHNQMTRLLARLSGYKLGCITDSGIINGTNIAPYALPRYELNEEFLKKHV